MGPCSTVGRTYSGFVKPISPRRDAGKIADVIITASQLTPPTAAPQVKSGVLSFAHLRPGKRPEIEASAPQHTTTTPARQSSPEPAPRSPRLLTVILVAKTAKIISTNYCHGCPRFLRAEIWERAYGNPYGRCRRDDIYVEAEDDIGEGGWYEVWRVIPASATVARCWYAVQEKKGVVEEL